MKPCYERKVRSCLREGLLTSRPNWWHMPPRKCRCHWHLRAKCATISAMFSPPAYLMLFSPPVDYSENRISFSFFAATHTLIVWSETHNNRATAMMDDFDPNWDSIDHYQSVIYVTPGSIIDSSSTSHQVWCFLMILIWLIHLLLFIQWFVFIIKYHPHLHLPTFFLRSLLTERTIYTPATVFILHITSWRIPIWSTSIHFIK